MKRINRKKTSNAIFSGKKEGFSPFLSHLSHESCSLSSQLITYFHAFLLMFLLPLNLRADNELKQFTSTEQKLSFSYSDTFTLQKVDLTESVAALKGNDNGYPTFNILVAAEKYDPSSLNDSQYRDRILNEYRKVGFTDVKNVRTYSSPISGQIVHTTELRYQYQDKILISAVSLLPTKDNKHFILTYIDNAEEFYRRKRNREEIVNSLKLNSSTGISGELLGEDSNVLDTGYWLILVVLIGAAALLFAALLKARAKS